MPGNVVQKVNIDRSIIKRKVEFQKWEKAKNEKRGATNFLLFPSLCILKK
jgi:hypothetical protein